MKYKNFNEWLDTTKYKNFKENNYMYDAMLDAWDAALDSFYGAREIVKLNILRKNAAIGIKVKELQAVVSKAMRMKCPCKKNEGCTCGTYKARATAIFNLNGYLEELKKS